MNQLPESLRLLMTARRNIALSIPGMINRNDRRTEIMALLDDEIRDHAGTVGLTETEAWKVY